MAARRHTDHDLHRDFFLPWNDISLVTGLNLGRLEYIYIYIGRMQSRPNGNWSRLLEDNALLAFRRSTEELCYPTREWRNRVHRPCIFRRKDRDIRRLFYPTSGTSVDNSTWIETLFFSLSFFFFPPHRIRRFDRWDLFETRIRWSINRVILIAES